MRQVKKNKVNPCLKEGYVLINEVESSLRISVPTKMRWNLKRKIRNMLRRDDSDSGYEVTIFVAAGPEIDKKVEEMNRRIYRKTIREKK